MMKKILFALFFLPFLVFGAELVADGKPLAEIIIGADPDKAAAFAASELQYHIERKTGASLPIRPAPTAEMKTRIYVGENAAILRDPALKRENFRNQEYLIRSKGNEIFLVGRDQYDKGAFQYADPYNYPLSWDEIATTYAVYDFLEKIGFNWYLPTELGITFDPSGDLTVEEMEIRRVPTLEMRNMHWGAIPADLCGDTIENPASKDDLNYRDSILWYLRRRHGGVLRIMNHSMYSFYQRFADKKSWFAQGYGNEKPPQLCYTNPEVIAQVVQDARDYFDGKVKAGDILSNVPADYNSDCFPVFPMDNDNFCRCKNCADFLPNGALRGIGQFSNDSSSNYLFRFVNAVAKEVKKSHPDKLIGTGAYASFAYPPSNFKLEDNVMVMMCLHTRAVYDPERQRNDDAIRTAWATEYPEMKKYVWMYYCFPILSAMVQQTRYFPGFFAGHMEKYFREYLDDGITGMFYEPSYLPNYQHSILFDQLEDHINWQLAFNKDVNAGALFDGFFRKYYGDAAKPMRDFYLLAESIYTNPANYPAGTTEQTDEIAWTRLGTTERMAQLNLYMEEAKKLAVKEPFKSRVALFDRGVWQYMQKGKQRYGELETLKAPSMHQMAVPLVAEGASGNPLACDWNLAAVLPLYGGLRGEALQRSFDVRTMHDGEWIYFSYMEYNMNPETLEKSQAVWHNDEWESFFAKQRSVPYRQVAIDIHGKSNCGGASSKGTLTESWQFPGNIEVKTDDKSWRVYMAIRLADIVDGGIKPGEILYYNLIRSSKAKGVGAWIPTFSGYHAPDRFGELYLERAK